MIIMYMILRVKTLGIKYVIVFFFVIFFYFKNNVIVL